MITSHEFNSLAEETAESSPEARKVLFLLVRRCMHINLDRKPLYYLTQLSIHKVTGAKIVTLWDICRKDVATLMAVLRACEEGFFSTNSLKEAIEGRSVIDVDVVLQWAKNHEGFIKDRLP